MSQNNNNEPNELAMVFGLIAAAAAALAFVIAAILAVGFAFLSFLALLFTVLSLFAWNNPLQIWRFRVEPDDAREFVGGGLVGGGFAASFVLFLIAVAVLGFDVDLNGTTALKLVSGALIGGYVTGSVGLAWLLEEGGEITSPVTYVEPTAYRLIDIAQARLAHHAGPRNQLALPAPPAPAPEPFRYASWDDEEARP